METFDKYRFANISETSREKIAQLENNLNDSESRVVLIAYQSNQETD